MEQQYDIMEEVNRAQLGKTLTVAVEGREGKLWYGRSYMDAPDIDTKVFFTSGRKHLPGDYVEVMIDGVEQYDLKGRALD